MQIHSFSFRDRTNGWEINDVSLNQCNLLVGPSGVGKTQILNSILALRNIAAGTPTSGIEWKKTNGRTHGRQ